MTDTQIILPTMVPASDGLLDGPKLARSMGRRKAVRAHYDAAQENLETKKHWANADLLAANAWASVEARRKLRARCRYEVANNPTLRRIVNVLVNYTISTGPRLQSLIPPGRFGSPEIADEVNTWIEREFAEWAHECGLGEKLRLMRQSRCESGECFALMTQNPRLATRVQLDLRLIEADQVASPWDGPALVDEEKLVDGIRFDAYGNPAQYHILKRHPGSTTYSGLGTEGDWVDADQVIHYYRATRPGQSRGIPELTPSLEPAAILRNFTLATLNAANQAATPGGVIHSNGPAIADAQDETESELDEIELQRGVWLTLPYGYSISQIKAEHPNAEFQAFTEEIVKLMGAPVDVPHFLATGAAKDYNYASAKVNMQDLYRSTRIDQAFSNRVVCDPIFRAWFREAILIERAEGGYLPEPLTQIGGRIPHAWHYDGYEHQDPAKEALGQQIRLQTHTTTLSREWGKLGEDWESQLEQRARELKKLRDLGVSEDEAAPAGAEAAFNHVALLEGLPDA